MLALFGKVPVRMQGMVVHGQQAEQVVVAFKDRFTGRMSDDITSFEILEKMADGTWIHYSSLGY
jgi:hypothetical protein